LGQLVDSARSSDEPVQEYPDEERARVYLFSFITGLRRLEMASLTPSSFALEAERPTVTVDAACSKHRRKDVLPLHPNLVALLREWLKERGPDEPLFPRLDRKKERGSWSRRTWSGSGSPYETKERIADFHAAKRHSHVTELLRHGAMLTEARELARHSDVRMTMRYTHIGLEDQVKALAVLPAPAAGGLHIGCISRSARNPTPSQADSGGALDEDSPETSNPRQGGVVTLGSPGLSSPGKPGVLWRRRELHPRPEIHRCRPLRA
jgi:hypothetical protein